MRGAAVAITFPYLDDSTGRVWIWGSRVRQFAQWDMKNAGCLRQGAGCRGKRKVDIVVGISRESFELSIDFFGFKFVDAKQGGAARQKWSCDDARTEKRMRFVPRCARFMEICARVSSDDVNALYVLRNIHDVFCIRNAALVATRCS